MKAWAATILLALFLCAACTQEKVYHHYHHTPVAGWEKADTLVFNLPPVAEAGRYATDLGLRINTLYPFTGLTLIVEQTVYPSKLHYADTIDCRLTDSNGNIKGQGVSRYQYHFHVSQMQLHPDDSLHITIRHDMKRELLPGISDIGIALNKLD